MDIPAYAVLWDMDGVLVDSGPSHMRAWAQTLAAAGIPFTPEDLRRTFGWRNDSILGAIAGSGLPFSRVEAVAARKEARFRQIVAREGLDLLPGVREWLERLHERGIPQAVVSSAPPENISAVLDAVDLGEVFATVISGDDVARGKPDPETYLLAANRLGMRPAACVVVEDAPAGIEAARRAGMCCLAVTTSHAREMLPADLVVDSLAELPEGTFERLVRRGTVDIGAAEG